MTITQRRCRSGLQGLGSALALPAFALIAYGYMKLTIRARGEDRLPVI